MPGEGEGEADGSRSHLGPRDSAGLLLGLTSTSSSASPPYHMSDGMLSTSLSTHSCGASPAMSASKPRTSGFGFHRSTLARPQRAATPRAASTIAANAARSSSFPFVPPAGSASSSSAPSTTSRRMNSVFFSGFSGPA